MDGGITYFYTSENFLDELRRYMVYQRRSAHKARVYEMFDTYWYSQLDYQVVEKTMWKVDVMIDYWIMQRKCIEWKAEHQARYQSLVGTPATD